MAERFAILCAAPMCAAPPRMAAALTRHGAEVCIVAPPDSYAALTRFKAADLLMPFDEMHRKLPAVARTMAEEFGAHSILAGDDIAFTALARLMRKLDTMQVSDATRALLARSMPPPERAAVLRHASALAAAEMGKPFAPPPSLANATEEAALRFAAEVGYPVLVKRDGFTVGRGIVRCDGPAALSAALAANEPGRTFLVQKFVRGRVYGVAVSGAERRAAGAFSFVKHVTMGAHGAASVLQFDHRDDLIAHAKALFEAYGMNGFAGVDYIVDESGAAHLLEINQCIVPKSHFTDAFGLDLVDAMLAQLRGTPLPVARAPAHQTVALFPLEWMRDPDSPYLSTGLNDAPWEDPLVLAAMIRDGAAQRAAVQAPRASL